MLLRILLCLLSVLLLRMTTALMSATEFNQCDISEFRCPSKDGQGSLCLPMDRWCNGKDDCDNRVDEPRSCSSAYIYLSTLFPSRITVQFPRCCLFFSLFLMASMWKEKGSKTDYVVVSTHRKKERKKSPGGPRMAGLFSQYKRGPPPPQPAVLYRILFSLFFYGVGREAGWCTNTSILITYRYKRPSLFSFLYIRACGVCMGIKNNLLPFCGLRAHFQFFSVSAQRQERLVALTNYPIYQTMKLQLLLLIPLELKQDWICITQLGDANR